MAPKRTRETLDHLSSNEIRTIVLEISCSAGHQKDKEAKFRKKYHDFAEMYPALFEMACTPNFDISKLLYMLELREKVMQNETTVDDASKEVGQSLFNEYVKPVLSKATPKTSE